jgi:hypothetical protein
VIRSLTFAPVMWCIFGEPSMASSTVNGADSEAKTPDK